MATLSRGLRVRAVKPGDVRALVEREPDDARRDPVLEWLDLPGAPIIRAYVIEMREPTHGPRSINAWLLMLTSPGAPCYAQIDVRRSDFRVLRRCRREDLHLIAGSLAAASASLNCPDPERRRTVTPAPLGRPAYSRSGRFDTNL